MPNQAQLALRELEVSVGFYFNNGIAISTRKAYASAKNRYVKFCNEAVSISAFPTSENILCMFVTYLAREGLKHSTIKGYLSGIRYTQISLGWGDSFVGPAMPRLEYVVKGIKKIEAGKPTSRLTRLPVTPAILNKLRAIWERGPVTDDKRMLWVACMLAFFGFLRISEMTVLAQLGYVHLSPRRYIV